jgi:hypothetical protein
VYQRLTANAKGTPAFIDIQIKLWVEMGNSSRVMYPGGIRLCVHHLSGTNICAHTQIFHHEGSLSVDSATSENKAFQPQPAKATL